MSKEEITQAKQAAAILAVEENVRKNMILGIGSGTTIIYAVEKLAEMLAADKSSIICIPTSHQSQQLIIEYGLRLGNLDQYPDLDLAIDGADEIDSNLNLIKGGGGCLVQEKIVAASARELIIVVDWIKKSSLLGEHWHQGVPIEIVPQARRFILKRTEQLGGKPNVRMGKAKLGPLVTDNGNFIIDVDFGQIASPAELHSQLIVLPGVVDTGIFVNMTSRAYIGHANGEVEILKK